MFDSEVIDYENAFIRNAVHVESWIIFLTVSAVAIPAFFAGITLKKQQGIFSGWWLANFIPIYLISGFPISAFLMFIGYGDKTTDYDLLLMLLMPMISFAIFALWLGLGFFMMYRPVKNKKSGQYEMKEKKELSKDVNLVRILSIVNFIGLSILTIISLSSIQTSLTAIAGILFVIQILLWISTVFTHLLGAYLMGLGKGMSWWWIANFILTIVLFINLPFAVLPMLMPDVWVYLAMIFLFIVPSVVVIVLAVLTLLTFWIGKKKRKVGMIPNVTPEVNSVDETEIPSTDLTHE